MANMIFTCHICFDMMPNNENMVNIDLITVRTLHSLRCLLHIFKVEVNQKLDKFNNQQQSSFIPIVLIICFLLDLMQLIRKILWFDKIKIVKISIDVWLCCLCFPRQILKPTQNCTRLVDCSCKNRYSFCKYVVSLAKYFYRDKGQFYNNLFSIWII